DANSKTKLRLLAAKKQKIKRNRFSKMTPITFNARDGLELHGYLSQPVGSKGNDPMVVMVHGGPFGPRDDWGWNREVQLLTGNGYAVLQINFRGSGGYGEEFEESGHLQWGKAMQDDLTDGTLWAVKQGYANKDKLCIYGASYGGYAAMMGVVKEPDLYKCAIGFVGLYDLNMWYDVGDVKDRAEGLHYIETAVGIKDSPDMAKYSPARHVDKIKAGIFLVHGKQDYRVPIEHFEVMTEALDKIGNPYEKMVALGEGHGFAETENQLKLYNQMLTFLAKYLK
ncbi:MAG: prolyl oligopeptidase family serine peptidase, partial [Psychrosphaera sp.]|nr:prolyl oligopeptidase family serine peptidase [Psychrosphaera sp.]